jgi:hypothetical protein
MGVFLRNVFKRLFKGLAKDLPSYRIRSALLSMAGYRIGSQVFIGDDLIIRSEMSGLIGGWSQSATELRLRTRGL